MNNKCYTISEDVFKDELYIGACDDCQYDIEYWVEFKTIFFENDIEFYEDGDEKSCYVESTCGSYRWAVPFYCLIPYGENEDEEFLNSF